MVKIEVIKTVQPDKTKTTYRQGKQGFSSEQFFNESYINQMLPVYFPEDLKFGFWFPVYLDHADVKIIGRTA